MTTPTALLADLDAKCAAATKARAEEAKDSRENDITAFSVALMQRAMDADKNILEAIHTHWPALREALKAQAETIDRLDKAGDEANAAYLAASNRAASAESDLTRLRAELATAQEENGTSTARIEALGHLIEGAMGIFQNCTVEAGCCCCGDYMKNHADPMSSGHTPVDQGQYSADQWLQAARAALGEQR